MGQLFNTIRQLVADEKYVVGQHASERLEERSIMEWQVVTGLEDGELMPSGQTRRQIRPWRYASPCPMAPSSKLFGLTCVRAALPSW